MMKLLIASSLVIILVSAGCGQKGPLEIPESPTTLINQLINKIYLD